MGVIENANLEERQDMNDHLAQEAVTLTEHLLAAAKGDQSEAERQQANKIAGMMHDPDGKKVTMLMLDQAFRSENAARAAEDAWQKYVSPTRNLPVLSTALACSPPARCRPGG